MESNGTLKVAKQLIEKENNMVFPEAEWRRKRRVAVKWAQNFGPVRLKTFYRSVESHCAYCYRLPKNTDSRPWLV